MFQTLSAEGYTVEFTIFRNGQTRPINKTGAIKVFEGACADLGKIIVSSDKTLYAVFEKGLLGKLGSRLQFQIAYMTLING